MRFSDTNVTRIGHSFSFFPRRAPRTNLKTHLECKVDCACARKHKQGIVALYNATNVQFLRFSERGLLLQQDGRYRRASSEMKPQKVTACRHGVSSRSKAVFVAAISREKGPQSCLRLGKLRSPCRNSVRLIRRCDEEIMRG